MAAMASEQIFNLQEQEVFERTVAVLKRLIDEKQVKFTFARGGTFRIKLSDEVVKDRISEAKLGREQFDASLVEIVQCLNAIALQDRDAYLEEKRNEMQWRATKFDEATKNKAIDELGDRYKFVAAHIQMPAIYERARLRLNSPLRTYDTIKWSTISGEWQTSNLQPDATTFAAVTVSLFEPTIGTRVSGQDFFQLIKPQVTEFTFIVDDLDIDRLIGELQAVKERLLAKGKNR